MFKPDTPDPTPADIAAGVKKTAQHQLADQTYAQLREKRDAVTQEVRDLIARGERHVPRFVDRVNALTKQEDDLNQQVKQAKAALMPLKAEHAGRILAALARRRSDACNRILAALDELRGALLEVDGIHHEVNSAGGEVPHVPTMRVTAPIEAIALRFRK